MGDAQNSAEMAIDVTEAAMLAALEAVRSGPTVTPVHMEAVWLGLARAAARWISMISPPELDEGFRLAFAKCLEQERRNQAEQSAEGRA
jgi:hypothetical protein